MNLDYSIVYSDRKTLNIIVERDKSVIVRAPKGTSPSKISELIEKKKMWIYEKVNHPQKYKSKSNGKEFVSGTAIMYLGRNYRLDIISTKQDGLVFRSKFIISKHSRQNAKKLFMDWYRNKAKGKLIPRIKQFANNLGVDYSKIIITDMKYRWGSCSPKNNLNFNWRLVKAPTYVIDYVIVHELAHLIELNHTKEFWHIVSVQVPNYKKAKDWLKEYGHLLESI